jgi:hypothetical protein
VAAVVAVAEEAVVVVAEGAVVVASVAAVEVVAAVVAVAAEVATAPPEPERRLLHSIVVPERVPYFRVQQDINGADLDTSSYLYRHGTPISQAHHQIVSRHPSSLFQRTTTVHRTTTPPWRFSATKETMLQTAAKTKQHRNHTVAVVKCRTMSKNSQIELHKPWLESSTHSPLSLSACIYLYGLPIDHDQRTQH